MPTNVQVNLAARSQTCAFSATSRTVEIELVTSDSPKIARQSQGIIAGSRHYERGAGILRKANLVSWKREGRERVHFINPVPINEIAERWISKFEYPRLEALSRLKRNLEAKES